MKKAISTIIILLFAAHAGAETKDYGTPVRPPPLPAEWAMPGHLDKDKLARWQRWLENHPKRAHAICVHMNEASGWDKKVCQPRWK